VDLAHSPWRKSTQSYCPCTTESFRILLALRYTEHMLSSILFKKHLEEDESLLCVVHKHWLLGFKSLFWPTALIVIAFLILYLNHARGMVIVMGFWLFVFLIWWLRNFFDYYLDAWLITDQGIIDIAWHGWFHRQSTRVLYSDLQGISYEIQGVLGTLMRFGTVSIEKISTGEAISLENVSNPKGVESLVLKSQETYLHTKNMKDAKHVQNLLATLVAEQIQLQDVAGDDDEDDDDG
jgi:hypothetical protein